jgi:hypothetical protein
MSDIAVISIFGLAVSILGSVLILTFRLGAYVARVRALETAGEKVEHALERIFLKLEALTASPPHRCDQVERLTRIETTQCAVVAINHAQDERMGRIQAEVACIQSALLKQGIELQHE